MPVSPSHSKEEVGGGGWGSFETSSFKHAKLFLAEDASDISSVHGAGCNQRLATPRVETGSTGLQAVTHLLDSEQRLVVHHVQGALERKEEELRQLRKALVVLSEDANLQAECQAENTRLRDAISATRAELESERQRREQSDCELERALAMLMQNMTHLKAEKDARGQMRDGFMDVSRQNRTLEEALCEKEKRLREYEQARQSYADAIDQLRVLELEVKTQGEHKETLQQQLEACKTQLKTQQQEHQKESDRLKQAADQHQQTGSQHFQELLSCRVKLDDSEQSFLTLRGQMEDISAKLQDAVQAYEERRSKSAVQKATIKQLTERIDEEVATKQALSHELDTASAEIVELRIQLEEVTMKNEDAHKAHEEHMTRVLASVEADRVQFSSIRALVEERYSAEQERSSTLEVEMNERIARLNQQLEGEAETGRATKEKMRKDASQLSALGKQLLQEVHQALEVERLLREELEKLSETGREGERLLLEMEHEAEEREAVWAQERDVLTGEVAGLRKSLARAEETESMLRAQVAQGKDRMQELQRAREVERARLEYEQVCDAQRALEAQKDLERKQERRMRGLERSFVAMFEEALLASLAPVFDEAFKGAEHAAAAATAKEAAVSVAFPSATDATGGPYQNVTDIRGDVTGISEEATRSPLQPPTPPSMQRGEDKEALGGSSGMGWEVSPVKVGGDGVSSLQFSAHSPTPEPVNRGGDGVLDGASVSTERTEGGEGRRGNELKGGSNGGVRLSEEAVRSAMSLCGTVSARCRTVLSACDYLKVQEQRAAGGDLIPSIIPKS